MLMPAPRSALVVNQILRQEPAATSTSGVLHLLHGIFSLASLFTSDHVDSALLLLTSRTSPTMAKES
jgi:hypothetical protein